MTPASKNESPRENTRRRLAAAAVLGVALLAGGCSGEQWPVLSPDGPIAHEERELLFVAFALMLIVVVPVYVLTLWVLLRYRASRQNPDYRPDWSSNKVDAVVWLGPAVIVVAIGTIVWNYTHRLDPYRPIEASGAPQLRIEAVAQDWKWLFIYPDEAVAVVNEFVIPTGRPVSFRITSDTVMNSLYIPGLAGQIYAMAGMQTRLNLLANSNATYVGRNTQYSGDGFADQQFTVRAVPDEDYDAWLEEVRGSARPLDQASYEALAKPSEKVPVTYYSSVEPGLFDGIIGKYTGDRAARRLAELDAYPGELICGPASRGDL